jgi:hypothetical protein
MRNEEGLTRTFDALTATNAQRQIVSVAISEYRMAPGAAETLAAASVADFETNSGAPAKITSLRQQLADAQRGKATAEGAVKLLSGELAAIRAAMTQHEGVTA